MRKLLKTLLPQLLEAMERHGHLQVESIVRSQLLRMSPATIGRQLGRVRKQAYGGRRKRVVLNRVRKVVPVRTFADWGGAGPGFLEVDFVAHCGERVF